MYKEENKQFGNGIEAEAVTDEEKKPVVEKLPEEDRGRVRNVWKVVPAKKKNTLLFRVTETRWGELSVPVSDAEVQRLRGLTVPQAGINAIGRRAIKNGAEIRWEPNLVGPKLVTGVITDSEDTFLSDKPGAGTGKIVFIDDAGGVTELKRGIKKPVSIRTVGREDISGELRERGYAGSDEEIDVLLADGLKKALDSQRMADAYRIIADAIETAGEKDKIEYSDKVLRLLKKNACGMATCGSCSSCEEGLTCFHYGHAVDSETRIDDLGCCHYSDGEQLILKMKGEKGDYIELPFTRFFDKPLNVSEIVEAAKNCRCADDVIEFMEEAAEMERDVFVTTISEWNKDVI